MGPACSTSLSKRSTAPHLASLLSVLHVQSQYCYPPSIAEDVQRLACSDVYIPVDYMTRLPRGIAFIEYTDAQDAEDAIYGLDRKVYDGREVSLHPASCSMSQFWHVHVFSDPSDLTWHVALHGCFVPQISVQLAQEGRKRPEEAARARFDYAGSPRRRRRRSRSGSRSRGRSRRARSPSSSRSRSRARSYTPSRSPSDR